MLKLFLPVFLMFTGCTRSVDWVKERANQTWERAGYEIIGYEGYDSWSPLAGGRVWYTVKSKETPGVVYSGYLEKWGDEVHVYGPKVVNKFGIKAN